MRELKFRLWADNKMKYITLTPMVDRYIAAINLYNIIKEEERPGNVLMQSTGLRDINGNEIYHDDIVMSHFLHQNEPPLEITDYVFNKVNAIRLRYHDDGSNSKDLEVIGNIHENPELLK